MDIDDILLDPKFKELDSFLTKEMYKLSDVYLLDNMYDVFGGQVNARNWFYSKSKQFNHKRPYDLCKEGRIEEVKDEIGRIIYGVF